MVESMITSFCELYGKKMNEKLLDAWVNALGRYRDQEIARAGQRAIEECSKFPTPIDVIQRIQTNSERGNDEYQITSGKCAHCGRVRMVISIPVGADYLCRECYTGMTNEQVSATFGRLAEMVG